MLWQGQEIAHTLDGLWLIAHSRMELFSEVTEEELMQDLISSLDHD